MAEWTRWGDEGGDSSGGVGKDVDSHSALYEEPQVWGGSCSDRVSFSLAVMLTKEKHDG